MSDDDHPTEHTPSGGRRFKQGNVGPDGDYIVGKGRPPKHSQFAEGDGRKRGRRPKGQRNFDGEFAAEAQRKVTIREGGKERRVSKQRSAIIRAFDNAGAKGQNQAINTIFHNAARIADGEAPRSQGLTAEEEAHIESWIAQRIASHGEGDQLGDPDDLPSKAVDPEPADGSFECDDG